jgi:hypothetical protein
VGGKKNFALDRAVGDKIRKDTPGLLIALAARTPAQSGALLDGFELPEPGVVQVHNWPPAEQDERLDDENVYGGVAVKH